MQKAIQIFAAGWLAITLTLAGQEELQAQYPVYTQSVAPAVVGYTAERRGLFGQRTAYRPIVAPVAAVVPVTPSVVSVARPVVAVARPIVTVARPVVPVVPQTVIVPQPVAAPVAAYYAPAAPVIVPTRAYRVPSGGILPTIWILAGQIRTGGQS